MVLKPWQLLKEWLLLYLVLGQMTFSAHNVTNATPTSVHVEPENYITDIKEHIYITLRLWFSLWIWCETCRKFHHISGIMDSAISFSQAPLLLNKMFQNDQLIIALRNYTLYLMLCIIMWICIINSNPNSRQGFSSLRDIL